MAGNLRTVPLARLTSKFSAKHISKNTEHMRLMQKLQKMNNFRIIIFEKLIQLIQM